MGVANQLQEVLVAIHEYRFVPSLEQVAGAVLAPVHPAGMAEREILYDLDRLRILRTLPMEKDPTENSPYFVDDNLNSSFPFNIGRKYDGGPDGAVPPHLKIHHGLKIALHLAWRLDLAGISRMRGHT